MNDMQALLTNLQNQIETATADRRAEIVASVEADLGALYYDAKARGDDTAMQQSLTAWTQTQALAAHAAEADAKAMGALSGAAVIAGQLTQVTDEYGRLITALEQHDLRDERVRNVHRDGFHDGYQNGQMDTLDREFFFAHNGDDLVRLGLPIIPEAMIAFARFVFDSDNWITEANGKLKQELADFVHDWTRRALVDVLIEDVPQDRALDDRTWWNSLPDLDDVFFGG